MSEGTDANTNSGGNDSGQNGQGGGQSNDNQQQQQSWSPPSSQDEFNRVIADRLARQKTQLEKRFEGFDEFKSKAGELDQLKEAAKSDLQKAQDREAAAEARAKTAVDRAVRAEVKALATGEFADPSDAFLYLGDLSQYVDKHGDIDSAGLEAALKEIGKTKPHLIKRTSTDVGLGARGVTQPRSMNDLIRSIPRGGNT